MRLAHEQTISTGERRKHGAVLHRGRGGNRQAVAAVRKRGAQVVRALVVFWQIAAELRGLG
jgi:hypothetical protein